MFADKAETLELYISILGLDKRYENPSSLGLGFTSYCSREQFWSGRRSTAAWKKRDRGKEGESEERREVLFCSLCGESIVRSRPSPWKEGKGPGNEGDRSFLAYYRRSKVSPILRPSSLVAHGQMVTISRQSIPTHLRKKPLPHYAYRMKHLEISLYHHWITVYKVWNKSENIRRSLTSKTFNAFNVFIKKVLYGYIFNY